MWWLPRQEPFPLLINFFGRAGAFCFVRSLAARCDTPLRLTGAGSAFTRQAKRFTRQLWPTWRVAPSNGHFQRAIRHGAQAVDSARHVFRGGTRQRGEGKSKVALPTQPRLGEIWPKRHKPNRAAQVPRFRSDGTFRRAQSSNIRPQRPAPFLIGFLPDTTRNHAQTKKE